MGYRKKRGFDLEFPDSFTDDKGEKLEVCIAGGTVEEYFTVKELLYKDVVDANSVREDMAGIYDILGPKLVSWNLEEADGSPIPFNRDTLAAQDKALAVAIVESWTDALSSVRRPLAQPSPDGSPSEVASIPTEPLSPAPAS